MNSQLQEPRDYRFVIGLLTGSIVGAGLAFWLVPRAASELRDRMTASARGLGERAVDQYQDASTRVGDAVDELTRKGQIARDDLADAVVRGAHEVERFAVAAKSVRGTARRRPTAV